MMGRSATSRRWTLTEGVSFDGEWDITGPDPERGEVVEVMPVAEHEALKVTARHLIEVMNRLGYASIEPEANEAWEQLQEAVNG